MTVQERQTSITVLTVATGLLLMAGWAATAGGAEPPPMATHVSSATSASETGASEAQPLDAAAVPAALPANKPAVDRSGEKRVGKASFYADRFGGRKMADGKPFRLHDSNAASRTLPLGTTAKVTNLETGKSAVVTIQDRGPYVGGRLVDLSPGTARAIGLSERKGLAKVAVTPITVPLAHGGVKLGQAADDPILALNERRDRGAVSQQQWDSWN
jgi:rare lipoprotein A